MKEEFTGPGCLSIIGGGCAILAVFCLIWGPTALSFVGSALAAVILLALGDLYRRVEGIEKHFEQEHGEESGEDNSNKTPEHISEGRERPSENAQR